MSQRKRKIPKKKKEDTLHNDPPIPLQEQAQPIEKGLQDNTISCEIFQTVSDPRKRPLLGNVNSNTEDTEILTEGTVPSEMHTHLPISNAHPPMEEEFAKT